MPFPYISACYSNCTNPECLVIARAEQSGLSRGFNHLQRVDDPHVTRQFSYLLHGLDVPHLGIQSVNNLSTYLSNIYAGKATCRCGLDKHHQLSKLSAFMLSAWVCGNNWSSKLAVLARREEPTCAVRAGFKMPKYYDNGFEWESECRQPWRSPVPVQACIYRQHFQS